MWESDKSAWVFERPQKSRLAGGLGMKKPARGGLFDVETFVA